MATNVRVIHANDFITATAHGTLDFDESKRGLMAVASAAGPFIGCEIILDTRQVKSHLSTTDLWSLASELAKLGATFHCRTAVLCPRERLEDAEFFALCAQNRGFNVRGFLSYEEAMNWLTESSEQPLLTGRTAG